MRIIGSGDFLDLGFHDIGNSKLVTIDSENVITGYGNPELRPGAIEQIVNLGKFAYLAVATNNKDVEFVSLLQEQLEYLNIPVLSGVDYKNKKVSAEMFVAASELYYINPTDCSHIDDQLLSFYGALAAGYDQGILVTPYGSNDHKGVRVGRMLDWPVRKTLQTSQSLATLVRSGI